MSGAEPTGSPGRAQGRRSPGTLRTWHGTAVAVAAVTLVTVGLPGRAAEEHAAAKSLALAAEGQAAPPPPQASRPSQPERAPAPEPWLIPVWSSTLPAAPAGPPAYDATLAFVPLRSQALAAVRLASGDLAWSRDFPSPRHVAAGDGLVFLSTPGAIQALAAGDGSPRWKLPVESRVSGPMLWDPGWLLAVTEAGTALAIHARGGQVGWQAPLGGVSRVQAAVGGERVYFALDDGRVLARRLATGDAIWERALGGRPAEILVLDDRLFVGATDNCLYCLGTANGAVKWRWRAGADVIGRPAADETAVFFVSLDNMMRALNRTNGNQRWRQFLATRPSGGPLPFDGTALLVAGVAAEVWAYRRKDGGQLAEVSAPAELASPPHAAALSNPDRRLLLLLTLDGRMQALTPRPAATATKSLPPAVKPPRW